MTKVELAPEIEPPTVGLVVSAMLLLSGNAAGKELAILSLYAWLARE
jgi:hypothetical protein